MGQGITVYNNLSLETTRNPPQREWIQKLQDFSYNVILYINEKINFHTHFNVDEPQKPNSE